MLGPMRSHKILVLGVVGALALTGCGSASGVQTSSTTSSVSQRNVQVGATFTTSVGKAVTYDTTLVPAGARVAVESATGAGGTTVTLAVRGLGPSRGYGAHVHAQPCGADGEAAGPHFQHLVDPAQPSVDPAYANPQNEIWLDLTTDGEGAGSSTATVPWSFERTRRPGSVVLHESPTSTAPGGAGARVGCVAVEF